MSLEDIWKNFAKTGDIRYYIEYKKLQNSKGNEDADKNRSFGAQSDGHRGERPPFNSFN